MNRSIGTVIALAAVGGCDLVGDTPGAGTDGETGSEPTGSTTGLPSTSAASSSTTTETTGSPCAEAPEVEQPCVAIFTKLADECGVDDDQIRYLDVYRDCYYDVTYAGDEADPQLSDRYACISELPCLELRNGDPDGSCDCHLPPEPEGTDDGAGECIDATPVEDPCGAISTKLIDECGVAYDQTLYYDVVRDCFYALDYDANPETYDQFVQWYSCISTLSCDELRGADPDDRCTCHQP